MSYYWTASVPTFETCPIARAAVSMDCPDSGQNALAAASDTPKTGNFPRATLGATPAGAGAIHAIPGVLPAVSSATPATVPATLAVSNATPALPGVILALSGATPAMTAATPARADAIHTMPCTTARCWVWRRKFKRVILRFDPKDAPRVVAERPPWDRRHLVGEFQLRPRRRDAGAPVAARPPPPPLQPARIARPSSPTTLPSIW